MHTMYDQLRVCVCVHQLSLSLSLVDLFTSFLFDIYIDLDIYNETSKTQNVNCIAQCFK